MGERRFQSSDVELIGLRKRPKLIADSAVLLLERTNSAGVVTVLAVKLAMRDRSPRHEW